MAQGSLTPPASETNLTTPSRVGSALRILAGLFIGCFFLFFTWRGVLVYYTGDDLMNLYGYWSRPLSSLVKANVFFWTPYYRPFGGIVYRSVFGLFGFNPYPLYVVYFAAMLLNLWLAYLVFKKLGGSGEIGAIATLLWAFHGKFDYLYYNAGSMYDVFCVLFFSLALLIYLRARLQGRLLGVWGTLGFIVCFVCSLNSKEMAATLPVIVLVYELLFHPPNFRSLRALVGWCFREGRMALLGALVVLIYLPGKLGADGLATYSSYIPVYSWARWLQDTETYLGDLFYRDNPAVVLGITPLSAAGLAAFCAVLIAIALWMRSRRIWFGLLFFFIALLPVSFIPARLGFVLYLPLVGLALSAAVCLVRFKESLSKLFSEALQQRISPASASVAFFIGIALVVSAIDQRHWQHAPNPQYSPYKNTIAEFSGLYPSLPHGARLLFVRSPLDSNWDLVFLLRMYYRDTDLFITELNGPPEQRIPVDRLPHYDHIFDFENGHYVELDNGDAVQSVQLHMLKVAQQNGPFGEVMTIGSPGAAHYVVKGVLVTDPKADGYWTLDDTELQFQLSSVQHHVFREHYYLPYDTLKVTGPLLVDFYINGHLLDQTRFAKDGEAVYQHDVPVDWLNTGSLTMVRMRVHNPYIAPRDGAKLGVLLRSAVFAP
ncbi:MAG: hypothetical protein ABSG13_10925 [Bryobacteraceae bacterium]|jgi:hypothetical protein